MKGLLLKDYHTLRRRLLVWGITLAFTAIVCVVFMISAKQGYVASFYDKVLKADAWLIPYLTRIVLLLFLLLSMAASLDLIRHTFYVDKEASSCREAGSVPVSTAQRVGARFLLMAAAVFGAIAVDFVLLIIVRMTADVMPFGNSMSIVLALAGVTIFAQTLGMFWGYNCGAGAVLYGNFVSLMIVFAAILIHNRELLGRVLTADGSKTTEVLMEVFSGASHFLEHKGGYVFLASLPIMAAGYGVAVWIAGRKREERTGLQETPQPAEKDD